MAPREEDLERTARMICQAERRSPIGLTSAGAYWRFTLQFSVSQRVNSLRSTALLVGRTWVQ